MIFSSFIFLWFFLPIVFLIYHIIKKNSFLRTLFLVIASLFFYGWGEPKAILLLLSLTCVNYLLAVCLMRASADKGKKKLIFTGAVGLNVALLCFFKYGTGFVPGTVLLPVGFSFFTFFSISFFADLYLGKVSAPGGFLEYALYVFFFPKIMQGPIMKFAEFSGQTRRGAENAASVSLKAGSAVSGSAQRTAEGIRRFLWGLSKKVLIADALGEYVASLSGMDLGELSGGIVWCMVLFYAFQIYFDFSGYSDMALGLGKLFGYDLPENFNYPYLSHSIKEFWQRWHITLGAWFKEYIYIPLGGSRRGQARTCLNLMIIFALSGAWHGNGLLFLLWGIYHGAFQVIENLGLGKVLKRHPWLSAGYTFLVVTVGWVFFVAPDLATAVTYLKRMLLPWRYSTAAVPLLQMIPQKGWFLFAIAVIGSGVGQSAVKKLCPAAEHFKNSIPEILICSLFALYSIFCLASATYQPFIYFRF